MKRRILTIGSLTILSLLVQVYGKTGGRQSQSAVASSDQAAAQRAINQYCSTCHSDKAKAAGMDSARKIDFDRLDIAGVSRDAQTWERVVRKLRAGMMPPSGIRRPDRETYKGLIAWLENELDRNAVTYTPPPGLHRLNRTEYANVLQDLLDLNIDPAKYLLSDDSTHGFDNIAGALSVSSTLVEAYVSAAQKISRLAIGEAATPSLRVYRTPEDTSQDYHIEGLPFGTRGGMLIRHVFPSDGEYQITITPIFGDNMSPQGFGSVPCEKLEVLLDGERIELLDWQGGGRTPPANCGGRRVAAVQSGQTGQDLGRTSMKIRISTKAGLHDLGVTFLQTNFAPILDLDQHFMRDTVQTGPTPGFTYFPHVGTVRIEGPYNAKQAEDSPSRRKIFICRPTTPADETACARKIISNLVTHAFRRPAINADVDSLMAFYQEGRREAKFEDGIENALARILTDPKFIYRIEAEPPNVKQGETYRVSDIDLASRLSFFLWRTIPDDELIRVAGQGKLTDPVVLEQQVRRMLTHPKAEALAVNFAGQWLNLRGLQAVGPIPMLFPDFDDPLRQAMRREVELLFDSIVREDRNVTDLLTADYTFINERLAKHYGIPNIYGSRFRRVTLGADSKRGGLLRQGSILSTTAYATRTSPVIRGVWILSNIFGAPPPPPLPNVPALDGTVPANLPIRERLSLHRNNAVCASCHRTIDPVGFALENFDAVGRWRDEEGDSGAIDVSGGIPGAGELKGVAGLEEALLRRPELFAGTLTEKLLTFALGRGVEYYDGPAIRKILREAEPDRYRFSSLILGIVKSVPFQMRRSS